MENPSTFELSLEQQFQMKLMEESARNMPLEQAQEMLVQMARLLLVKDNVIRNLVRDGLNGIR